MTSIPSESVGQSDIGSEGNLPPVDETEQFHDCSWRQRLERSSKTTRHIRGSNYVQLATVDGGEPRCRSVVFRGFVSYDALPTSIQTACPTCDDLSCCMRMVTDARSEKVKHIQQQPVAELLWWFPKLTEQYRIRGQVVLIGSEPLRWDTNEQLLVHLRKQQWGNLSDAARESFLDSKVPGADYDATPLIVPSGVRSDTGQLLPPPDNFLLMLLLPKHVDYLRLSNMYRQVDELNAETGEWTFRRVNP